MLATLLLYAVGALFLLLVVVWLAVTVYLCLVRRRYAHIPSPNMPSFYLGHMPIIFKALEGDGTQFAELMLQWTQEVGPVFVWFSMHIPFVFTMNPDDVKEVCTKSYVSKAEVVYSKFATLFGQRFLGRGLVTIPDYDTWKPRRSLYDPAFTRSYLKSLVPTFNECVDQFLESLRPVADGKTQVPMKDKFAALTLNVISKVAFGTDFTKTWSEKSLGLKYAKGNGTLSFLIRHTVEGIQASFGNPLLKYLHPNKVQGYREAARAIRTIGRDCIQKRIRAIENGEQVPDDILTHILQITTKEENVDIEDLIDDFATFYIAGQDTTSTVLTFSLVLLCQHPDILERVLAEISEVLGEKQEVTSKDLEELRYLEQVFMESLRLYPPTGGGLNKQAPKGLKLSNYEVPEGTIVMVSSIVSSHSPEFFEDPLIFNPSRFDPNRQRPSPFVYFPFGIGHRSCIGKVFAMMEAKAIMSRLLQQFRVSLPEGYKLRVEAKGSVQPKGTVPCTLVPV